MKADLNLSTKVLFLKNHLEAKEPTKATPGSAAYDLYVYTARLDPEHDRVIVDTGISTSFDPSMVMLVFSRSGLAMKHGIRLANSVAVIDSDYRGNIMLLLKSDTLDGESLLKKIHHGDRVAQAIFMPVISAEFVRIFHEEEHMSSARGVGGFGSTGS